MKGLHLCEICNVYFTSVPGGLLIVIYAICRQNQNIFVMVSAERQ